MKVHHLNCGTMRMPGFPMVAHVLLIETDNGLVLVDTGFGLGDIAHPVRRVGFMGLLLRPVLDPEETAVRQVARLGFAPQDVRHIVMTHLDLDHAGGLSDFPHAQVHVTSAELRGAIGAPSIFERIRYQSAQFAHHPRWVQHTPGGESWRGFAAAQELTAIAPGIILISLPGHTRGHAAVAVETDEGWLLHSGDAFYDHGALDHATKPPFLARTMERVVATDRELLWDNHRRLAALGRGAGDLRVVSAHDPADFAAVTGSA